MYDPLVGKLRRRPCSACIRRVDDTVLQEPTAQIQELEKMCEKIALGIYKGLMAVVLRSQSSWWFMYEHTVL